MGIRQALAVVGIAAAGLGALTACGWGFGDEHASDSATVGEKFTSVRFENDSGNVTISTGDTPSVKRDISYHGDKPHPTHHVEDGTLVLEPCPDSNCEIDYTVVVPEGTKVDGEVSSGDVEITGTDAVNVKSSSGNVTVKDVPGTVNAEASSGEVELTGIGDDAQVQASSGNVAVELVKPADVRVDSSSGEVEVGVPSGSYRVRLHSSGEVDSDVEDDPSGDHSVDVHADSGNVTLHEA